MKPSSFIRASLILFFILALQFANHSVAFAQNPDTLKAAVPYSVFPIGGMRAAPCDTLQRMIGANFNWDFGPDPLLGTLPTETSVLDTPVTYNDPFYYDTTVVHSVTDSAALCFFDPACAVDVRAFMPGTSPSTQEYTYNWDTNLGQFFDIHKVEWMFDTATVTSGQYVLYNHHGGGSSTNSLMTDPFQYDWYGTSPRDSNHIGTTSYEFVFYFSDLSGVSNTTPLYSIEYWSLGNGDSTLIAVDTITKNLWNSLSPQSASTQVTGRNVGAENLGSWKGQTTNTYRLLRHILNTRPLYKNNFTSYPVVDVRLRTFKQIPMYFRLMRARDWRAQRLLTGKADSIIGFAIRTLLAKGDNARLACWGLGNEFTVPRFHAWAYVNDLLAKNHAPRANILAPYNYNIFINVQRDQSQYHIPAHLWYESEPFGGNPWHAVNFDSLGHPYRSWFYPFGPDGYSAYPSPLPSDVASDSLYWAYHDVFIQKDFNTYTSTWQTLILGYPSETTGGGIGIDRDLTNISKSCYEYDPLHPLPFDVLAQSLANAITSPLWNPIDSLYWVMGGNNNPAAKVWADTAYVSRVLQPYLAQHPGQTHIPADSIYNLIWQWRPPTVSEMYYTLWSGIAHGMKGYCFNTAYDDQEAQNGFLWDTTASIILKSQDRKEIEFHFYNGYLVSPYTGAFIPALSGYTFYEAIPPAYKTLFPTAQTLMRAELGPVAAVLSILNWNGSVSWPWRDSTPTYFSRLPVKSVQSRSLTGSLDSASLTYVDFGIHKHPNDTSAVYITMQNRRLWTDSLGTSTIDSRKVSFKIDTSKFPGYASWTEWSIRDVSKKNPEQIIGLNDSAVYTLKAGQGILLRIAPVIGLD